MTTEYKSELRELARQRGLHGVPKEALCFFRDGNAWCCVHGDFANLQETPAGFGETFSEALDDLALNKIGR